MLVTLDEYKTYMGKISPVDDAKISFLIPKVTELVNSICRRHFNEYVTTPKVEVQSGGTGYRMYLSEFPVINVISVETSVDYGQTFTSLVPYTDYSIDPECDAIVNITSVPFTFKPSSYKITYTAGYPVLPADLKLAVLDLIKYYMDNDQAVHSTKAPGTNTVQIEYITTTGLPSHIRRVLDMYMANYN